MKSTHWLVLSLLACGINSLYTWKILLPWEHSLNVTHGRLKADLGDLYPRWIGTRELLEHRQNPYGAEVSHEIQLGFYGHGIEQQLDNPGSDVVDEQRFAYPVYVVFLLAPVANLDFPVLQRWAPLFLAILTALSVLFWLNLLRWRPSWVLVIAIVLFVLSSPQAIQGLRLRQLGLSVAFLLAISTCCVVWNRLTIAGIFLAFSTIKPQMAILPLAWFLFWAASDLGKRWRLLAGFGITLFALVGTGEILLPGWPIYFLNGLAAYRKYFPTTSLLCLALGRVAGGLVSALAILALFVLAWHNRHKDVASPEFLKILMAALIGEALVLPILTPYNQMLLLLPSLLIVRDWASLPRIPRRILASLLAWPYFCSAALLLHRPDINSDSRVPLLPSAVVLLVPYFVLLLFAVLRGDGRPQLSISESASVSI
jgi:hypothetical protein